MSGPFTSRLKEAIMPLHEEAERVGPLRSVAEGTATINDYKNILMRLHGFVAPAEEMIVSTMSSEAMNIQYDFRRRLPDLEKDLGYLGVSSLHIEKLPKCSSLPLMDNPSKALGLIYLFEGSRLGGQVLAKALRDKFSFKSNQGYAYFGSDGMDIGPGWKTFRATIEEFVHKRGNGDEIISSALGGFSCLNSWLMGK